MRDTTSAAHTAELHIFVILMHPATHDPPRQGGRDTRTLMLGVDAHTPTSAWSRRGEWVGVLVRLGVCAGKVAGGQDDSERRRPWRPGPAAGEPMPAGTPPPETAAMRTSMSGGRAPTPTTGRAPRVSRRPRPQGGRAGGHWWRSPRQISWHTAMQRGGPTLLTPSRCGGTIVIVLADGGGRVQHDLAALPLRHAASDRSTTGGVPLAADMHWRPTQHLWSSCATSAQALPNKLRCTLAVTQAVRRGRAGGTSRRDSER